MAVSPFPGSGSSCQQVEGRRSWISRHRKLPEPHSSATPWSTPLRLTMKAPSSSRPPPSGSVTGGGRAGLALLAAVPWRGGWLADVQLLIVFQPYSNPLQLLPKGKENTVPAFWLRKRAKRREIKASGAPSRSWSCWETTVAVS